MKDLLTKSINRQSYFMFILQLVFLILFAIFVRYHPDADARYNPRNPRSNISIDINLSTSKNDGVDNFLKVYPSFQDINVMLFLGIGFLMSYLRRYSYGAIGFNFLLGSLTVQWAIIVNGFFNLQNGKIFLDLNSIIAGEFSAVPALISAGVILGTTTPTQLIIMSLIEIPFFVSNDFICRRLLGVVDIGGSILIHVFAGYFGLACSVMLGRKQLSTPKLSSSYISNIFSCIGTIFLWLFWPSFNSVTAFGDDRHRAILNTYVALCSSCLTTYAVSSFMHPKKKFDMVHVQNSTLSGGVAIGIASDLMINPWGSILVGMVASIISAIGFSYVSPFLNSKFRIHDTCGVHNLHGLPGLFASIVGIILAAVASEADYGVSLYEIYPFRAPLEGSDELKKIQTFIPDLKPGQGRSAGSQALYQFLTLLVTLVFSIVGGLIAGLILKLKPFNDLKTEQYLEDEELWIKPEEEEEIKIANGHQMNQSVIHMS